MSPKSQAETEKEPVTQEIAQDELRELIATAWENGLRSADHKLRKLQTHQRLTLRARTWLTSKRERDCQ